MNKLPRIIAIDFDGTLVEDNFPEIGNPDPYLFTLCRLAQVNGIKVILWTCRNGESLDKAVRFCEQQGLVFDAVNDNLEECKAIYGGNTRKVFADIYFDDKATFSCKRLKKWFKKVGVNSPCL